jgi:hypothetical protein
MFEANAELTYRSARVVKETAPGKNRIMIFGPKDDGTYVVEFRTAAGEALEISIPRGETAVIQERMPYGLFVPEVPSERRGAACRSDL